MKKHVMNQNSISDVKGVSRRHFVKIAGITAFGVSCCGLSDLNAKGVSIILDPADLIAGSPPSKWAVKELEESLTSRGIDVNRCEQLVQAKPVIYTLL